MIRRNHKGKRHYVCQIDGKKKTRDRQINGETQMDRYIIIYYPTLLRRVQIMRETSTNITRYLYSSYSPDRAKDQKPWQVRIMAKRKRWIIRYIYYSHTKGAHDKWTK